MQSVGGTKAKSAIAKANSKPKPKPKTNVASTSFNPDDAIPPVPCQESNDEIYGDLYQPKSSVLRSTSVLGTWEGSGIFFTNYMNRNYLPRVQRRLSELRAFVYLSRPGQSVLTQMKGVCDVLLLAILNNRPFQCTLSLNRIRSSADYANLLPPHFFASPLFSSIYPITLPDSGIPKKPSIYIQNAAVCSSPRSAKSRPSPTTSISPTPPRAFPTETSSPSSTPVPWESPRAATCSRGFSGTTFT